MISEIEEVFDATVPVQYPESIHKVIDHVVLSPGAKHALPIMCIASREFVGLRSTGFPIACALEMVHAASLVHDNLPCMDASPLRHGYPFAHALLGIDMVVITNDPLFPLVYKHIVTHTPSPDPIPLSIIPLILTEITRAIDCIGINGVASLNNCPGLKMLSPLVDDVLMESNDNTGKMRSNVSIIKVVRMDCRLELVEEVRAKAKKELEKFKDKYGEKVLPLYSFVDYAIESCFMVKAGALNPFQL
ncbi:heterodimeric geranylgeranyl pyrophosphate synthase small subunit, chloroplastic-like [Zingiber officinale]|uniref:heterodimeric geranylgeranyl pyrophosphate synthase small subunit, chloroplastic-like n=1 Tax=Zingiber officinale TaxID=94328 RepID=UPI001C4CEC54|nr:heterodimeric geranylgeranyl pyrophosphate synthase small subunit, chloroplastic-like [Zingiber officinale]